MFLLDISSSVFFKEATPPAVTNATENQNSLQPFNSFIIDYNTFLPATLSFNKILGTKSFCETICLSTKPVCKPLINSRLE